MFKKLIAKGHPEFSGGKQQDALEFWHHFIDQIKQKEHVNRVDPTDIFNFQLQVSHGRSTPHMRLFHQPKEQDVIAAKVELND